MTPSHPIVFLIDVDNTLLDNDEIQRNLKVYLADAYGDAARDRYWKILEDLFEQLGYRDYLGALQRYRIEHPTDIRLLAMSSYLVDYPFCQSTLSLRARRAESATKLGADGDTFRWRRGLSTSPDRALGNQ